MVTADAGGIEEEAEMRSKHSLLGLRLYCFPLAAAAILAAPASASPFCDQLRTIGAAASGRFASYRGEARAMTSTWFKYRATATLPGASICEIDSISEDFTCDWELASKGEAKRRQAELVRDVGSCLPGTQPRNLLKDEVGFFVGSARQPGAYVVKIWSIKSTAIVIVERY